MVASQSSSDPLVVVVGSTGNQGSSVINALLASSKSYRLRGLTRDTSKGPAKDLEKKGVETYAVDISVGKEAEVKKAFEGAAYVFGVTNFWAHASKSREIEEGKLMVDAAKAVDAIFLWSALYSCADLSNGKYAHVDHFDGKAEVTKYAQSSGAKIIVVQPGYYMSNHFNNIQPAFDGNGKIFISTHNPDTVLPQIDTAADYGLFVQAAIEGGYKPGDEILSTGENINMKQTTDIISEASGIPLQYVQVPDDAFHQSLTSKGTPEAIATEFAEMNAFQRDCGYYGGKEASNDPAKVKGLAKKPSSLKEWAGKQDWSKFK